MQWRNIRKEITMEKSNYTNDPQPSIKVFNQVSDRRQRWRQKKKKMVVVFKQIVNIVVVIGGQIQGRGQTLKIIQSVIKPVWTKEDLMLANQIRRHILDFIQYNFSVECFKVYKPSLVDKTKYPPLSLTYIYPKSQQHLTKYTVVGTMIKKPKSQRSNC